MERGIENNDKEPRHVLRAEMDKMQRARGLRYMAESGDATKKTDDGKCAPRGPYVCDHRVH